MVKLLAEHRWPFRLHATYDESISRFLDVFERVNREVPFNGLRWFFDHTETVTERNLERIKALGGGIAVQHRMTFQGEYFVDRYGAKTAEQTPPLTKMLAMGIPVGAGTDATRVASYNPWVSLAWLVTRRTVGGLTLYPVANRLDRATALRLYTQGSAWMSGEEAIKGGLAVGQLGDVVILSADYFRVPEEKIRGIESVLTVVGGLVSSLRTRGEFAGDDLETLLIDVPEGTIKPKQLLLVGIGDQDKLSLNKMEQVGKVALREAVKLRATRVAFAPLIRDQGNDTINTGDVETAVTRGILLAYDTERRLQKQGFAKAFTLEEWVVEAGPTYYDETIAGVKKAVSQACDSFVGRDSKPYSTKSK